MSDQSLNPNLSMPQFQPTYRRTIFGTKKPVASPEAAAWLAEYHQSQVERNRREIESHR
jgi:hypothetical protein